MNWIERGGGTALAEVPFMKRLPLVATFPMIAVVSLGGCNARQGELGVELSGPAVSVPFVFHGNCVAGWSVAVDVRLRETGGRTVVIRSLTFRLTDEGRNAELGGSYTLTAAELTERFGGNFVPAHGSRVYRLAGRADARPEGPILLAGAIDARDESGRTVATSFRSSAPELVVHDPDLSGGPCPITGSP